MIGSHSTAAPQRTQEPGWRDAWSSALHAVELDVEAAEDLLARLHAGVDTDVAEVPVPQDWIEPSMLAPLPADFAERARRLLQRQMDVSERLAEAMVQARSQRRAMAKLEQAEHRPVYFDRPL
ncbi:hypothetical protein CLV92_1074 [Kineococcus xinjiangensis]|uniref:Uncharacterized protein n=1 Tax=Kineococcus xinjiangensis TaxID=512762 RepID=A0A2S6IJU6_9ACTN|nr:hypothetical protein [Kineococcus xinjiangensis]PPK94502.1 hypothetical protein CLV92_1074 [Kineococcus xinjiangensis]